MDITVTNSVVVKPANQTPHHQLWLSSLDLLSQSHTDTAYIYRPKSDIDSHSNVCVYQKLREALSKTLVYFYPLAGILVLDATGRIAVNCNGDGALFVEAVTDSQVDDLKDLGLPSQLRPLVPAVEYSDDVTTIPPLMIQVTRFKCGGVALGMSISHILADGTSALHFVKTWCDIARGSDVRLLPVIDRTVLRVRSSPQPSFVHTEYAPSPPLLHREENDENVQSTLHHISKEVSFGRFILNKEQVNALKAKAKDNPDRKPYTTFETLAAHLWKCSCTARNLSEKQKSKVYIGVDGRNRLVPPLPSGYFGNARLMAAPIAISEDIVSKPIWYSAAKIHEEVSKMNDHQLRSQLEWLELNPGLSLPDDIYGCPNMQINSWRLPLYDADFGCGKPIFMGHAKTLPEGFSYIIPSHTDSGSVSVCVALFTDHMSRFEKLFWQF